MRRSRRDIRPVPRGIGSHLHREDLNDDDDGPDDLAGPSDVRRRLAADRTVGAFEKLRRQEQAKQREAAERARKAAHEAEQDQLRMKAAKRKRRASSRPINVDASDDEEEAGPSGSSKAIKQEPGDDATQAIVIKDESDEEDIKPLIHAPQPLRAPRTPSPPPRQSHTHQEQIIIAAEEQDSHELPLDVEPRAEAHNANFANTPDAEPPPEDADAGAVPREDIPWPEPFERLEEIFKALNTVYSFCSARKHLATTFDTLRSSVEKLVGRELEVHHIAQLKSLLPDLINFAYVDSDALEVHLDAHKSDASRQKRAEQDEIYEEAARAVREEGSTYEASLARPSGSGNDVLPSVAALQAESSRSTHTRDDYVLLFEFNDGTLQGAKATARGRRSIGMRRGPNRDANKKQPLRRLYDIPSTSSMKKLIDKRNAKFESAVCELLAACQAKGEDPVDLLVAAANDHVPLNPETAERPKGETPRKKRIRLDYLMNHPDERPPIKEVIDEFEGEPWWCDQVVPGGRKTIPAREARFDGLTFVLTQELVNALWATRKIEEFFLHQAEALNYLDEGLNVIVSTSTSSGKSLIYQVPIVRALETDLNSTAMFIFPTKALAQDQKRSLEDLISSHVGLAEQGVMVATYDGDTDKELRLDIRDQANVIFTNPDMLHQSILPNEHHWRRLLRSLRFVVVDELHTYNGLFGAHVSLIMRRLRRMCNALGNRGVQFISCSATVANPREHMQTLFGITDVQVVTEDGSPCGAKEWLIWNPPLIDEQDPKQGRVSAYAEVSKIFRHLVSRGVRTIIFTKVRRTCEIVISQIKKDLLLEHRHDIVEKVASYRSGYSAQDRRKIEQDMWKGSLLGIVATSALELGIDIGSLDAVIMLGFPYSISSLRQQSGRAGRRLKDSLTVLCCDPFPMDQHYARFPEDVFEQPDSALSVDLSNDFVLEAHLQCAAEEMPLHLTDDAAYFGPHLASLCRTRLVPDDDGFYHCRSELRPNPARQVAIRGARQVTYSYIDATPGRGSRVMEEVEIDRAIFEAFEGAVFMHQGQSYICKDISHDMRIAQMVRADVNFHTRPRDHTDTDATETLRIRALRGSESRAYFGKVTITTHVWGYFKVDKRANILDAVDVDCPPFVRHTRGFWLDVPMWVVQCLVDEGIQAAAAIHAAEHALLSLTPMFVVSLAGDVRTECKLALKERVLTSTRKRPARLIFYDLPGQNGGICEKSFEHLDGLIRIAVAVIEACGCAEGCPGCVTSQTCAYANQVTSKAGALAVLRALIGLEPFVRQDGAAAAAASPSSPQLGIDENPLSATIAEAPAVPLASDATQEVEEYDERLPPSLEENLRRLEGFARMARDGEVDQRPAMGKSLLFSE